MNRTWKHLKDEYLELSKECPKVRGSKQVYTAEMIYKLMDMAEKLVYPDENFSDEECNLWFAFSLLMARES